MNITEALVALLRGLGMVIITVAECPQLDVVGAVVATVENIGPFLFVALALKVLIGISREKDGA